MGVGVVCHSVACDVELADAVQHSAVLYVLVSQQGAVEGQMLEL